MRKLKKKGSWFGMLESSRGDTVLVWDSLLPRASPGKVYMYNTSKDAVIEYVEDIVQPKLRDLTPEELKQVQSRYGARWRQVRSRYEPVEQEPVPARPPHAEDSIEPDAAVLDDDVYIDDDYDYY